MQANAATLTILVELQSKKVQHKTTQNIVRDYRTTVFALTLACRLYCVGATTGYKNGV
jgi:hypothetical protein